MKYFSKIEKDCLLFVINRCQSISSTRNDLSGKVRATFYDLDDSLILSTELSAGDCAIVFKAGHGFEVLEDDTTIYEFKTGPYFGVEADKTFIKEKSE